MTRCAIYIRVSDPSQHAENQLPALRSWVSQRGYEVAEVYTETETAWRTRHQKELSRLVTDAYRGRFEILVVWALDRLSREVALAILQLVSRLNRYGVKVLSYQESWTEAPGELAELLYALTGWVARMESQRRSERTKAGLARAVAQGKKLGRPQGSKDKRKRRSSRRALYDEHTHG